VTRSRSKARDVQSRALRKAAELLGGRKPLAERLAVQSDDIEKWTLGGARIPHDVFLRLVDLILDELASGAEEKAKAGDRS
jgi:hypothetical protein